MEKLDGKSRFVIELKLYGDYSSIEEIKKELEIQLRNYNIEYLMLKNLIMLFIKMKMK